MSITAVVRGNLVIWEGEFLDNLNAPILPDSTLLTVRYPKTSFGHDIATPTVNYTGTDLYAEYDTTDAYIGTLYWSLRGVKDDKPITVDGQIEITANAANKEADITP